MNKNHILIPAVAVLLLFGSVQSARAFIGNSGQFMFRNPGNNPYMPGTAMEALEAQTEQWLLDHGIDRDIDLTFYAEVDAPEPGYGPLQLTYYDPPDPTCGKWSTTGEVVEFYSVKAGQDYAFYWIGDPGATEGLWSTEHLANHYGNIPSLSDLAVYNAVDADPPDPPDPIPAPAGVVLAAIGSGIAALMRRSRQI